MKQEEYFGFGSIKNLRNILIKENSKNIFLVTGRNSFEKCRAKFFLADLLKKYNVTQFNDFTSNPDIHDMNKGYKTFSNRDIDTIIGIGGGSVIDVSKFIKLSAYNNDIKIPLIAIPTTAGSGSESTYFIVYYNKKEKQSKGIEEATLPDYLISDPQFTLSLPKKITASTGIDALCQAIESYWSINSTEESKRLARKSIKLLLKNLETAVNNPSNESRKNMMNAANLAGKAINITKTTACHSISYPITSYFNIPHGHAVSLTLGEMLIYNSQLNENDCLDKRGEGYVKKTIKEILGIFKCNSALQTKDKINDLMDNIGLETKLSVLGLEKQDLNIILKNGFAPERVKDNPRLLTEEQLNKILNKIY